MNNFVSLRYVHDNAPSIWKYMTEHTCSIKKFGKSIYEGKMSEGKYLKFISDEDAPSMTIECYVNPESTIFLTIDENPYIEKVKSMGSVENIFSNPKLYCEAINMISLIPMVEGKTWQEKIRYVIEEEEEEGQSMGDDNDNPDENSPALGQEGAKEDKDKELRSDIKFKIYTEPDKQVDDLKEGEKYLKIEYVYKEKKAGIEMDFLIGRPDTNSDWQLYVGKLGATTYDDDPYKSLETKELSKAINTAVDEAIELIKKVKEEKDEYVQFYIHR